MNDFGRVGAYFALFSEIAIILLVTTVAGTLGGNWLDERIGTRPLFVLTGLLLGFTAGGVAVFRLITRFLSRFDR
jgi:F0F1-type ATP synthase assembly protein I